MREKSTYIDAGRIVNTHGVRGELKVEVWLDSPEYLKRFERVFLNGQERKLLSGFVQKQFLICALEGVGDLNAAIPLKGRILQIAREDAKLPPGAYFQQDILGCPVFRDTDGEKVGVLEDILERPASDIYVVRDNDGEEHLIPAVPEFIREVDADEGRIVVHMIEGM